MIKTLLGTVAAIGLAALAAVATADDTTDGKDWSDHVGDLPFIVGYDAGMQSVQDTGKPPMFFFTTTW